MKKNNKICVVGLGGVGGTIGAMLASHHEDVAFYARGPCLASILEHGLKLSSAAYGEVTAFPAAAGNSAQDLGVMDFIFLCVKNYSLEAACAEIRPMVGEHTAVIPLLNGIDVSRRIRAKLDQGIVLDGLVYVVAGADPDFTIRHTSPYCRIHIGFSKDSQPSAGLLEKVKELLERAGLTGVIEPDIEAAIWTKYILNCAYNVVTANYGATTEELRGNPIAVRELETLLAEACLVARTLGVQIPDDLEAIHLDHFLHHQAGTSTSSLKRDIEAGRPNELDVFSGKLLELAAQCDVQIPMTRSFYQKLLRMSSRQ